MGNQLKSPIVIIMISIGQMSTWLASNVFLADSVLCQSSLSYSQCNVVKNIAFVKDATLCLRAPQGSPPHPLLVKCQLLDDLVFSVNYHLLWNRKLTWPPQDFRFSNTKAGSQYNYGPSGQMWKMLLQPTPQTWHQPTCIPSMPICTSNPSEVLAPISHMTPARVRMPKTICSTPANISVKSIKSIPPRRFKMPHLSPVSSNWTISMRQMINFDDVERCIVSVQGIENWPRHATAWRTSS